MLFQSSQNRRLSCSSRRFTFSVCGSCGKSFTEHTITTLVNDPTAVLAADLDGDGDTDVLSSSWRDNLVAWYENDGAQHFSRQ